MPRSYSFDHYLAPKRDTTLVHDERDMPQEQYTEAAPVIHGETKIHYGKKFSQTEELFQARRMNHQLEELAGITDEDEAQPPASAELPEAPQVHKSSPIGALPPTEEATTLLPETLLHELRDTTALNLRQLRSAARDLWSASFRLATLPLEVARLAARRLRPVPA
ncbi:MAG: hypothetical protein M3Y59_13655 [Myxococcota bacterium]|nr:hypothetical protein [Myxococcota bacterium]